ncbi:MAG: hypothetical protein PVI30_24290 [Myxococcales bacterium]|jgi:hypothetical protein
MIGREATAGGLVVGAGAAVLALGLVCPGCAADSAPMPSREASPAQMSEMPAGQPPTDSNAQPVEAADFGNSTATPPATAGSAAPRPTTSSVEDCTGGLYLGTYDCDLTYLGTQMQLAGDVSFALEIDETVQAGECDAEFCPDLVIAEGSGTLFGLAFGWGFEAQLEGGLDCSTGQFRASAPDGVYGSAGSSDPTNPDALWTVILPLGTFTGTLDGEHNGEAPEAIGGDWDLQVPGSDIRCTGPFTVELQP